MSTRKNRPIDTPADQETMKQLVTSFWDAFDKGDFDAAGALLHPSFEELWPNTRATA